MRIVGGTRRGLRLRPVPGHKTRPTSDRVKEALFNILAPVTEGAVVLDLFAGTGSLGIEALSRGATASTFVDNAPAAVTTIRDNLRHTGLEERARVLRADARRAVGRLEREGQRFAVVFIDPPYGDSLAVPTVEMLAAAGIVEPSGRVVVEHALREDMPARIGNFSKIRSNRYGDTVLSFYVPAATAETTH